MEGDAVARLVADTWPTRYTMAASLSLTRDALPNRMTALLVGANAEMGKALGLPLYGS